MEVFSERHMATELEAKLRVSDHDGPRSKLRQLRAERAGAHLETNNIFDDRSKSLEGFLDGEEASFIVMADRGAGAWPRSEGAGGVRAMWQCTHSRGWVAANGSTPVSI